MRTVCGQQVVRPVTAATVSMGVWFCGKKILVDQRNDGMARLWVARVLMNHRGLGPQKSDAWVEGVAEPCLVELR